MTKITVKKAMLEHFKREGLPADGGYEQTWTPLKLGWLTFYIFNSQSRKRAVKLHDIHHVVTGYKSDARGEAEISAWELAAGTHDKHFARLINLAGLFYGAYIFPKTTFRAFIRGKYSRTLYNREFSADIVERSVESLQKHLLPTGKVHTKTSHFLQYILLVGLSSLPALLLLSCLIFWITTHI